MNRKDFYFEQLVTQADMDSAFDYAENADHFLQQDNGYVGITAGLEVVEEGTPDLTVDIAAGNGYDQDGQRLAVAATQNLDLSVDSNAVSTAVAGGGNEKWISVFIAFDRTLSDARVDGNGTPLSYERSESFQFIVDQGAEASAGTAAVYTSGNSETFALSNGQTLLLVVDNTPAQTITFVTGDFVNMAVATAAEVAAVITANGVGVSAADVAGDVVITSAMTGSSATVFISGGTGAAVFAWPAAAIGSGGPSRPALRADAILLGDVLFRNGGTTIIDSPDDGTGEHVIEAYSRREWNFVYTGASFEIKTGTITAFATALAQEVTNHINETGASHGAAAISYDPTVLPIPAGWSDVAASGDVQTAVDGIVNDLAESGAASGALLVGYDGGNVSAGWATLAASTELQNAIDNLTADLEDGSVTPGADLIGFDDVTGGDFSSAPGTVQDAIEAIFTDSLTFGGATTSVSDLFVDGQIDVNAGLIDNVGQITFDDGPRLITGSGTPEAVVTAPVGSMFMRTDGGAGTSVYIKESGAGNTGWAGI